MIANLFIKRPLLSQTLLGLVLLALLSGSVAVYLYRHHQDLIAVTLENHITEQQRVWDAVLQGYNNGMEAYFNSIVMQEPVLSLLRLALDGDERDAAIARVDLLRLLHEPYSKLHRSGVRQMQFHTPDSISFLRLHYPHRFGDSLKEVRPTVVETNRTLTPSFGFEGGRAIAGFRNVFPIIDKERHLGSFEMSQALEVLRNNIDRLYLDTEFVLLIRYTEEEKLFEELRALYSPSVIDRNWLIEDPRGALHDTTRPLSGETSAILPQLQDVPGFSTTLNNGTAASFVVKSPSRYHLVTTTPIFDIHNNLAATLLSFQTSDQVAKMYRHLYIDIGIALTLSALLALTLMLIFNRMARVQTQRHQIAAITESVHGGLYVVNNEGNIIYTNQRSGELLGYSPVELLGAPAHELFHVHTGTFADCPIAKVSIAGIKYRAEELFKRKDGTEFPVDVGAVPVDIGPGEVGAVVVFDDISERKQLEAQYLQAQKMESVGILAGGIAHDFNNILSAISGFSHLVLHKMSPDDPLRKHIDHIVDASERATALTRELLLFSRKQPGEFCSIDLNAVLEKTRSFLLRTLDTEIKLLIEPAPSPLPIRADSQQLQQVIINLAINARDAMSQGGTLHLTSRLIELKEPLASYRTAIPPGSYALLTISDEGTGIDSETLQNIFHPFFTTKEVGKGTGLGLAVAYGIVQQHKGFIRVESTPGTGTCFFIYLPITEDVVCVETQQSVNDSDLRGNATILLAEDEVNVRAVMTEILETAGYHVISAADGVDAVRLFESYQQQIHLLLFDIMMPNLNGKEAADQIRRQCPDMPILFLSGYAPDSLRQRIATDLDSTCLLKPVEPVELLKTIKKMLKKQ